MTVVTRFAPSPTGMLHIGGARTALFNLLFAKRHGGKYLLRVEDTDRRRSTPEAVDAIFDGLSWLGLMPDEPPIMQFERAAGHVAYAEAMLAEGKAFRCYATPDELQARRDAGEAKRKAAKAEGLDEDARQALLADAHALLAPFRSPWRDGGRPPAPDAPFAIRLRAPDDEVISIDDAVQGPISIPTEEIDDLVLVRADGTPTYMLAVVADDHDMGVTHVIRGDDHLRNAFRQAPIYAALGWPLPVFAHVPMIHGDDGAKLSKRHGALGVHAYRDMGYLPEALTNYLLRLGWSFGDREIFSVEEAAAVFDLSAINRAPARLDLDKLNAINAHYIRAADHDRIEALVLTEIETSREVTDEQKRRIRQAVPHMTDRGATIPALAEAFDFLLVERPIDLNKKARKAVTGEGLDRLSAVRDHIAKTEPWRSDQLETALKDFCARAETSLGKVGPPLRAALTGGRAAPEIGLVLEWLGREESLDRLTDIISTGEGSTG